MADKKAIETEEKSKAKLGSTSKSMAAGAVGALIAIVIVLGSFGVVRAMHDPDGRGGFKPGAPMMQGAEDEDRGMHRGPGLGGEITKIEGSTITLKGRDDQIITISVSDKTTYKKDASDAKLSDLKVGNKIMVRGDVQTISVKADSIGIRQ